MRYIHHTHCLFLFLSHIRCSGLGRKGRSQSNPCNVCVCKGSQSQGCRIVVQLVSDGPPHSPSMGAEALRGELANGELEREASTSFTDLEAGTYNVLIYDVEVDGTFDLDKSLYNELIEVKNMSLIVEPVPTITSTSASPGMSCTSPLR